MSEAKIVLRSMKEVSDYFSGKGVHFYPNVSVFKPKFKNDNHFFLRVNFKEASSAYSKQDIWCISINPDFETYILVSLRFKL